MRSFFWERPSEEGPPLSFGAFLHHCSFGEGRAMLALSHHGQIVGMAIASDFQGNYRCQWGGWLEPQYRGVNSHLIGRQVLTYLHAQVQMENVYAMTPWFHAKQFAYRCGMRSVAEIPDYFRHGNKTLDIEIFLSEREIRRQQHVNELIAIGYGENTARKAVAEIYDHVVEQSWQEKNQSSVAANDSQPSPKKSPPEVT